MHFNQIYLELPEQEKEMNVIFVHYYTLYYYLFIFLTVSCWLYLLIGYRLSILKWYYCPSVNINLNIVITCLIYLLIHLKLSLFPNIASPCFGYVTHVLIVLHTIIFHRCDNLHRRMLNLNSVLLLFIRKIIFGSYTCRIRQNENF